jgi:hypothetical protein
MIPIARSVGIGAVACHANPKARLNVDLVFVAALRTAHIEKVAHGVSLPLSWPWVAFADATLASPRTGVRKRKVKPAKISGLS